MQSAALGPRTSLHWKSPSYITPGSKSIKVNPCSTGVSYRHFPKPELNWGGYQRKLRVLQLTHSKKNLKNLLLQLDQPAVLMEMVGLITVVRLLGIKASHPDSRGVSWIMANLCVFLFNSILVVGVETRFISNRVVRNGQGILVE